jgi:hypothetical protein
MPTVTTQIDPTINPDEMQDQQYSPPNWSDGPALYSLIINNLTTTPVTPTTEGGIAGTNVAGASTTMFVFDGMKLADHEQSCIPTQHPLQAGYNIADHAVLQPARVVLEVVMSDAIAAYSTGVDVNGKANPPMWSGNPSKSVSAFQQMINLMQNRALITLNTRLQTYFNMLLVNVRAPDDQKTYFGASMTLTFQQLFIGTIAVQSNSARSQTTENNPQGQVNGQIPDSTVLNDHTIGEPNGVGVNQGIVEGPNNFSVIPGSGTISSNNTTGGN